jgi:flagellin
LGVTVDGTTEEQVAWQKAIAGGIVIGEDASADEKIDWENINLGEDATVTLERTADGDLKIALAATDGDGVYSHEVTFALDAMEAAASDGIYSAQFHGVSFDLDLAEFANAGATTTKLDLTTAVNITITDVKGTYGLKHDFTVPTQAAKFISFSIDGTNAALAGISSLEISFDGTDVVVTGYAAGGTTKLLNSTITLAAAPDEAGDTFEYNENGIAFEFELIANADGDDITVFTTNKIDISSLVAQVTPSSTTVPGATTVAADNSLRMQIGANNGQAMAIDIADMRSLALGISSDTAGETKTVQDSMGNDTTAKYTAIANVTKGTDNTAIEYALDVSTSDNAAAAIKVLDDATATVSSERAKLGAIQNRLDHTINNLGTSAENLTAAESRIRDVDMAKEMMEFAKNSILQQAAQAMLAQANQQPQGVLQLLR